MGGPPATPTSDVCFEHPRYGRLCMCIDEEVCRDLRPGEYAFRVKTIEGRYGVAEQYVKYVRCDMRPDVCERIELRLRGGGEEGGNGGGGVEAQPQGQPFLTLDEIYEEVVRLSKMRGRRPTRILVSVDALTAAVLTSITEMLGSEYGVKTTVATVAAAILRIVSERLVKEGLVPVVVEGEGGSGETS